MINKAIFIQIILTLFVGTVLAQTVTVVPSAVQICPMESVQLTASGASYYFWSPSSGLSDTIGSTVTASPSVSTTFTVTGLLTSEELVRNGNFNQGNVGFQSSYQYSGSLYSEGTYCVGANAHNYHSDFTGMGHGGSGNFMVINGAPRPGITVWKEQIEVLPNTYYAFSTWVCSVCVSYSSVVAKLQFSINGNQIGDIFSAPRHLNRWEQFYVLWYSGNSTNATISILNQNTEDMGNDFGLDDISFCRLEECVEEAQSVVNTGETFIKEEDAVSCETYEWHGTTYSQGGDYQCEIENPNGCDSLIILHLTINEAIYNEFEKQTCPPFIWNGITYYVEGDYEQTFIAHNGCDSIITMHLTFDESFNTDITVNTCEDRYMWNEMDYFESGVYQQSFLSSMGCDSIVNLHLTMGKRPICSIQGSTSLYPLTDMFAGVYPYFIDSTDINPSNVHWNVNRDDWILITHGASCDLVCTSEGQAVLNAWTEGEFCDVDTTLVLNATFFDIDENEIQSMTVFPNPTSGIVTIACQDIVGIKVYNIFGQLIKEYKFDGQDKCILDIGEFIEAVCILEISTSDRRVYRPVVLKQ